MSVIDRVDVIKKTVVYFFSGRVRGRRLTSPHPLGTGFIVGVPHHEAELRPDGSVLGWPYIVTAKHLLESTPGEYRTEIFMRANLRNWSPSSRRTGVVYDRVPILDNERNLQWAVHSNSAVDLAVKQIFPNPKLCEFQAIPEGFFATSDVMQREQVSEGDEVFFPCFTPEILQIRRNYPVIRFGRFALVLEEPIQTPEGPMRFHFVECFPFGGNSGSPVFLRFGPTRRAGTIVVGQDKYFLLGIMKGYWSQAQPIDVHPTESRLSVRQSIGIAAVTPVDYLKDVLNCEAFRRQRGEID